MNNILNTIIKRLIYSFLLIIKKNEKYQNLFKEEYYKKLVLF